MLALGKKDNSGVQIELFHQTTWLAGLTFKWRLARHLESSNSGSGLAASWQSPNSNKRTVEYTFYFLETPEVCT